MIAHIIPTKKLPRSLSLLTYLVPENLRAEVKIGQLVTVPLRHALTNGVIYDLNKNSESINARYPLKKIINIQSKNLFFTKNQLTLFMKLAAYYRVSASLFVYFNLPKLIKKDWLKFNSRNPSNKIPASRSALMQKKTPRVEYFWWSSINEKNIFYKKTIAKTLKNNGQILILVPRVENIFTLQNELNLANKNFVPIHRRLSRAENLKIWLSCSSPEPKIFIGTRSAIFYPFARLQTIILDAEHSSDHKQSDMNPRYDLKIACQFVSRLNNTQIIYSSPSPSVVSYYNFSPAKPPSSNPNISLVDLNDELTNKNFSFISDKLAVSMAETLAQKKNIFLLINKKGEASATSCRDCGHTFTCPTCHLPLIKSASGQFICYFCRHSEDIPPFCPACTGPNFKSTGLGLEKIALNLKKNFSHINITKIYKESTSVVSRQSSVVILGTEYALNKIAWSTIGLVGIINAGELWQHAEYLATESAYGLLHQILTSAPNNAKIIIQTFAPDHYLLRSLVKNEPAIFYDQELIFRKKLSYPPFASLIKLSCLNKNNDRAKKSADLLCQKIKKIIGEQQLAPYPIFRQKIRGQYKYNLILKLKDLNTFNSLINLIPNDWQIDLDPRRLME